MAIRKGLVRNGLPQKKLAVLMGVSPALVSGWVSGRKIPTGDDLIRIIEILELVPLLFPKYQATGQEETLAPIMVKEFSKLWEAVASLQIKMAKVESVVQQATEPR